MNEEDVRRTYHFLRHSESTEIRLIDPWGCKPPLSYYASDVDSFVEICRRFDGIYNIYVGMNERTGRGTRSEHVSVVNATVIDVDSIHPKGQPATEKEMMAAGDTAKKIFDFFERRRKHPALAMSGNGWQIWLPLHIRLNDENRYRVEAVLKDIHKTIISEYQSPTAKVDNIGDLARVIKVIGTRSIKPEPAKDRPNRISSWATTPAINNNEEWSRYILKLAKDYEPEERVSSGEYPAESLTKQELDEYLLRMSYGTREMYEGDWKYKHYQSRSEAEMGLLTRMALEGFSKDEAWRLMEFCKIGKWNTANHAYRSKTIEKAYAWANKGP